MNKLKPVLAAYLVSVSFIASAENTDILTGDVRLSCEAILCLSSGDRPSECAPSIKRYFSIKEEKMKDTIRKRKDFLSICPSSKEKDMPELVNAIANGAGRCDAKELNRVMRRTKVVKKCQKTGLWHNETTCTNITINYIEPKKPKYCTAYEQQGLTYQVDQVKYVGQPDQGGRWVNIK
jgi:hypothetical protein